jgi:uncharacterized metal-binding protein
MKIKSRKIGLISCSGEDLPEGTISRVATRRILEERDDTVTICLPLFLAGGQEERDFAKENPCVTVDGCEKRCAAVGVKKYGGVDAKSSIVISEIVKERKLLKPSSRSKILPQDEKLVQEVMSTINQEIKEVQEGKD